MEYRIWNIQYWPIYICPVLGNASDCHVDIRACSSEYGRACRRQGKIGHADVRVWSGMPTTEYDRACRRLDMVVHADVFVWSNMPTFRYGRSCRRLDMVRHADIQILSVMATVGYGQQNTDNKLSVLGLRHMHVIDDDP